MAQRSINWKKDRLWDAIKKDGGENPTDLVADIKITDNSIYGIHTVESGDTLSKIAKALMVMQIVI